MQIEGCKVQGIKELFPRRGLAAQKLACGSINLLSLDYNLSGQPTESQLFHGEIPNAS